MGEENLLTEKEQRQCVERVYFPVKKNPIFPYIDVWLLYRRVIVFIFSHSALYKLQFKTAQNRTVSLFIACNMLCAFFTIPPIFTLVKINTKKFFQSFVLLLLYGEWWILYFLKFQYSNSRQKSWRAWRGLVTYELNLLDKKKT